MCIKIALMNGGNLNRCRLSQKGNNFLDKVLIYENVLRYVQEMILWRIYMYVWTDMESDLRDIQKLGVSVDGLKIIENH